MQEPTTALVGVTGLLARLVSPLDVQDRRLSRLLGTLWLTGGVWVLLAWGVGGFDDGWPAGVLGLAIAAVLLGTVLVSLRPRRLGVVLDLSLTMLGAATIAALAAWGGPVGAAALGILYVYVAVFAFIALRPFAMWIVGVSAGMHAGVLAAAGHPRPVATWILTWGTALMSGMLAGTAVAWLRDAAERLRSADEYKTRFIATVSHELRTPLTAILGFAETLQRGGGDLTDEQRRHYVEVIDRQARRQLRLVQDVLTMTAAMAQTGAPLPERLPVREVVHRAVESVRFEVELEVCDQTHVRVDPGHLQQVIENLLVNAERYGARPIKVAARPHEDRVAIEVIDHGSGIPGGLSEGLLEPFAQGDSGDRRESSGVGLGLTIVRDLVAANGGCLEYLDTAGGGATVRVLVPSA